MDTGSLEKVRAKMVMLTSQRPSSVKMKGHCTFVGSVNMCDNSGSYSHFVPKSNSQDVVEYVIFFFVIDARMSHWSRVRRHILLAPHF